MHKLTEPDDREHLLRRGMTVVDLGAAPGSSWTQIVRERLFWTRKVASGPHHRHGHPPDGSAIEGVTFLQGDSASRTSPTNPL